jgi:hypothetical protein
LLLVLWCVVAVFTLGRLVSLFGGGLDGIAHSFGTWLPIDPLYPPYTT